MKYSHTNFDGVEAMSFFLDGKPVTINPSHSNWRKIREVIADASDEEVRKLLVENSSLAKFISKAEITDSVSVTMYGVRVRDEFIHGDLVNEITKVLCKVNSSDAEDYDAEDYKVRLKSLALFLEKLTANQSNFNTDHIFKWIEREGLNLDPKGNLLVYKGVMPYDRFYSDPNASVEGAFADIMEQQGEDGVFGSSHQGPGLVSWIGEDGVRRESDFTGHVPNFVGATVSLPRHMVDDNPNVHCSNGLHAGTEEYANSFAPALLLCRIDPRDIVSVPNDSNFQKIRTSRYTVLSIDPPKPEKLYEEFEDEEFFANEWDDEDDFEYGDEEEYEDRTRDTVQQIIDRVKARKGI